MLTPRKPVPRKRDANRSRAAGPVEKKQEVIKCRRPALQVFEITMGLIDALSNGMADHAGTADYKARTASVINNLLPELYLYSDTRTQTVGRRPTPAFITDLTQPLDLDDVLASAVLPHGLASALLAEENRRSRPTMSKSIWKSFRGSGTRRGIGGDRAYLRRFRRGAG